VTCHSHEWASRPAGTSEAKVAIMQLTTLAATLGSSAARVVSPGRSPPVRSAVRLGRPDSRGPILESGDRVRTGNGLTLRRSQSEDGFGRTRRPGPAESLGCHRPIVLPVQVLTVPRVRTLARCGQLALPGLSAGMSITWIVGSSERNRLA
jgi:hypothetical protein